ncbi:MAG: aspartate aminotransferase family protein [Alphaproteobacteria bacterium]|nr:aspartate aminotransferase family protein [Alphaproteobacteria bacterium]
MSIDEPLRRAAELAIAYRHRVAAAARTPTRPYADLLAAFDAPTPETGSDGEAVIDALAHLAEPGLRATVGPRFFGWVIGASHPVGVAADWLTAAWGQNAGNHTAAPAAAAAETVAARWLLDILDLPRSASVGFVTGATVANFVCLAAARGEVLRRLGWDVETKGLFGAPPFDVVIGDDAHSTVFSALQFLGLGHDRVRRVETDDQGRVRPAAFARAMAACDVPPVVVLQAGQLNTGAFDPMPELLAPARERGAWIHVDGAFGLWARACPTRAALAVGVDGADSWATDGHKWLQTPYDCGYAIVRDAAAHERAMTIAASYLPTTQSGERDPSHFVPELSRRARGFATWAMIRHLGRRGIAEMVERHCRLAARIASALAAEPGVTLLNDVALNQVVMRFGDGESGDAATQETIRRIQDDGTIFAGGARWRGRWALRLSVISATIDETEADRAVDAVRNAWRSVRQRDGG